MCCNCDGRLRRLSLFCNKHALPFLLFSASCKVWLESHGVVWRVDRIVDCRIASGSEGVGIKSLVYSFSSLSFWEKKATCLSCHWWNCQATRQFCSDASIISLLVTAGSSCTSHVHSLMLYPDMRLVDVLLFRPMDSASTVDCSWKCCWWYLW